MISMEIVNARAAAFSIMAVVLCLTALDAIMASSELPVPSVRWKAGSNQGDDVRLAENAGIISVSYAVAARQHMWIDGRFTPSASVMLELKQPLDLPRGESRVLFEARIVGSTGGPPSVRPIVENESGERFSFVSTPEDAIKTAPAGSWMAWKTKLLQTTEAGGAAKGIYEVLQGRPNASATGRLRLVGLEIRVNKSDTEKKEDAATFSGEVLITNIRTAGPKIAECPPTYADAFLKEKGAYRIAFQARAAFQGAPFAEEEQEIAFNPKDEASRRQLIRIPIGELHNSWIRYRITNNSKAAVDEGEFQFERNISPAIQTYPVGTDPESAPAIGLVRVNTSRLPDTRTVGGVYRQGEPFRVTFRVFRGDPAQKISTLKWVLTPYAYKTTLSEGQEPVEFPSGQHYVDIPVALRPVEGRNAYMLYYSILDATGRQVDSGNYTLGIQTEKIPPYATRPGVLPDRREIKKLPYFHISFNQPKEKPPQSEQEAVGNFKDMLVESAQMTPHVSYRIDLPDFEILPGVFDFSLLDQIMDTAADYNSSIAVRIAHRESAVPFRWHPYTRPRNFDGTVLYGQPYYGAYSLTDPEYAAAWKRAFHALYSRYGEHRAFEGYYLFKPGGEWIIPDKPWNGEIADYSWSATEAFQHYLKNDLKLDLKQLNQRWGKTYAKWSDVLPPQPDFSIGAKPDLRPEWVDFSRCKLAWNNDWTIQMSRDIRSYDASHILIVYVRLLEEDIAGMAGLVDYQHNGGQYGFEAEGRLVEAWEKYKIGWISEPYWPHYWARERDGWVLDWTTYIMLSQAGGGGANIHVSYSSEPSYSLAAHYGSTFAYDRYEMFKPILRELHQMKLVSKPKDVAVIQDNNTLLEKHRSTFRARLLDLSRGFDMLKMDAVDFEYYQPENEGNYKIVVLNSLDQVVSRSTLDALVRMVENGAMLVMNGRSAEYCTEQPGERYPLLKKLGIKAPESKYDTLQPNIQAATEPGGPLAGISDIHFYSQADYQKDLRNPQLDYTNWIYRWLPETDYFGYFPGIKDARGQTFARFGDGGAAISLYGVGKGRVLVFWGTVDQSDRSKGLMSAIAKLGGVPNSHDVNGISRMLEGNRADLDRHYALTYQEISGTYLQKIPNIRDGDWFVDDMVTGERYGYRKGEALREEGIRLAFAPGSSPLKILRFIPRERMSLGSWPDLGSKTFAQ